MRLKTNISGSLFSLVNWKGQNFESYTLVSATDYYFSKSEGIWQKIFNGKAELGFIHIIDSVWDKQSDLFNLQYTVKKQDKKITRSWSAVLNSQFLNSFTYESVSNQTFLKRKWTGTFMNPSAFELGCGMNVSFWNKSMLNLALASARFRVDPVTENKPKPENGVFGKINRGWLIFDYGVSGQLLVIKSFSPGMEWNSTGKVFLKGIKKEAIQFDMSNTMSYKIRKNLEMRADVKCVFDPMVSYRLQYRNEILFGIIFNAEK